MTWYKNSKKHTAPIPENFDVIEKGDKGEFLGWNLWAGANDWESGVTLMALLSGEKDHSGRNRVWVKVNNKKFPKGNNSDQPKEILNQIREWGEKAKSIFLKEFKKNLSEVSKRDYEYSPIEAAIDTIKSDVMKPFVEDWGIDQLTWVEKSKK